MIMTPAYESRNWGRLVCRKILKYLSLRKPCSGQEKQKDI